MDRNSARAIERIKQEARADARAMGETYARRLDVHAASVALRDWRTLQGHARAGDTVDPSVAMVARGAIAGRTVHVDAEFAMRIRSEEIVDERAAYDEALARSIDVDALAECLSRPAATDREADYRLRRDVVRRAFWRGAGGSDRLVQATSELVAALAHLAADPAMHAAMVAASVLPAHWVGRPASPYMLRDALLLSEAYREDPLVPEQRARRDRADEWWNGVAHLIDDHLPLGVSGWLHDLVTGGIACGHSCGHGHHHDHGHHRHHHGHDDQDGGHSRDGAVLIAFERIDHVCDALPKPPPPSAQVAAAARERYEEAMRIRYARRLGGAPAEHADAVRSSVDTFLRINERGLGDPTWHWDAGMARRFADLDIERLQGLPGEG